MTWKIVNVVAEIRNHWRSRSDRSAAGMNSSCSCCSKLASACQRKHTHMVHLLWTQRRRCKAEAFIYAATRVVGSPARVFIATCLCQSAVLSEPRGHGLRRALDHLCVAVQQRSPVLFFVVAEHTAQRSRLCGHVIIFKKRRIYA